MGKLGCSLGVSSNDFPGIVFGETKPETGDHTCAKEGHLPKGQRPLPGTAEATERPEGRGRG